VRLCERNNSADTKVSEEGRGRRCSRCWSRESHGAPALEQPVPEGLHSVGRTHTGAAGEELQPMRRTHVEEVCGELSPVRGTSHWSRGRV